MSEEIGLNKEEIKELDLFEKYFNELWTKFQKKSKTITLKNVASIFLYHGLAVGRKELDKYKNKEKECNQKCDQQSKEK